LPSSFASGIRSASRIRKESGDVSRATETVEALTQQLRDLQAQLESEVREIQMRYETSAITLETIAVKPKKTNINVRLFTLAWDPQQ